MHLKETPEDDAMCKRHYGMHDTIGTLEIGKRADIVLFNPNKLKSIPMHDPLATIVYPASAENIDATIVNGKVVYQRGVFSCGVDEEWLAEQVKHELRGGI